MFTIFADLHNASIFDGMDRSNVYLFFIFAAIFIVGGFFVKDGN